MGVFGGARTDYAGEGDNRAEDRGLSPSSWASGMILAKVEIIHLRTNHCNIMRRHSPHLLPSPAVQSSALGSHPAGPPGGWEHCSSPSSLEKPGRPAKIGTYNPPALQKFPQIEVPSILWVKRLSTSNPSIEFTHGKSNLDVRAPLDLFFLLTSPMSLLLVKTCSHIFTTIPINRRLLSGGIKRAPASLWEIRATEE